MCRKGEAEVVIINFPNASRRKDDHNNGAAHAKHQGTQDTLPAKSYQNQYMEQSMLEIARNFGYHEIRTPVFEHTELFQRSVGDTTDVVQKEMYTFDDKGGRSITLRPEGRRVQCVLFLSMGCTTRPCRKRSAT